MQNGLYEGQQKIHPYRNRRRLSSVQHLLFLLKQRQFGLLMFCARYSVWSATRNYMNPFDWVFPEENDLQCPALASSHLESNISLTLRFTIFSRRTLVQSLNDGEFFRVWCGGYRPSHQPLLLTLRVDNGNIKVLGKDSWLLSAMLENAMAFELNNLWCRSVPGNSYQQRKGSQLPSRPSPHSSLPLRLSIMLLGQVIPSYTRSTHL